MRDQELLALLVKHLRMQRISLGMSQTTVAEMTGIKQSYLCQIEIGHRQPGENALIRIGRALWPLGFDRLWNETPVNCDLWSAIASYIVKLPISSGSQVSSWRIKRPKSALASRLTAATDKELLVGNATSVAASLGCSRVTLYKEYKRRGLKSPMQTRRATTSAATDEELLAGNLMFVASTLGCSPWDVYKERKRRGLKCSTAKPKRLPILRPRIGRLSDLTDEELLGESRALTEQFRCSRTLLYLERKRRGLKVVKYARPSKPSVE